MAHRQVVLDTETTGLNAKLGDRVIEIGCIEVLSRTVTDRHFHTYLNPERKSEEAAIQVHGISDEFLADKPKFAAVAKDFLDFIAGAELIIHNAGFDVEFLDHELARAGLKKLAEYGVTVLDSLAMARELHPGKRNSLDALCERYAINNAHRTLHGALLDARLLAEVYLAMTRGQETLVMELDSPAALQISTAKIDMRLIPVISATAEEIAAHEALLDGIDKAAKGGSLWRRTGT